MALALVEILFGTRPTDLPSLFLHAGLDIMGGLQTLATGRAEWLESPRPLVWESGPDPMFWLSAIATLIFGTMQSVPTALSPN